MRKKEKKFQNIWMWAFLILLVLNLIIVPFLLYKIFNLSVTVTYMREGYDNTEQDLKIISEVLIGRISKSEIIEEMKRNGIDCYERNDEPNLIYLNRIKYEFNEKGILNKVSFNW